MKTTFVLALASLLLVGAPLSATAQDKIYRCGNEYTNNASQAKERGCRLVEGGNVTIVQGGRSTPASTPAAKPHNSGAPVSSVASPAGAPKVNNTEHSARDADARAILEAELQKAQARADTLRKEYNDGTPQRTALELRNPQVYQERTEELKASLSRAEADVAGIKRELGRMK